MNFEKIKEFLKQNVKIILEIIIGLALIFFLKDSLSIFFLPNKGNQTTRLENKNIRANYNSDLDFIDCLIVQHKCVFKNIEEQNSEFIVENCKGENYCAENHNPINN